MRREFVCIRHSNSKLQPITGRKSETARNIDGPRIGKNIRRSRYILIRQMLLGSERFIKDQMDNRTEIPITNGFGFG